MTIIIVVVLLVVLAVIFGVYGWCKNKKVCVDDLRSEEKVLNWSQNWSQNYELAKNKIISLGFTDELPGLVCITGESVEYVCVPGDTHPEGKIGLLRNFEKIPFGEEISLYLHKDGKLVFLILGGSFTISGSVYEKA